MRISRENQHIIADIVLRALARGICAVSMFDKRVAADIKTLGNGFSFAVCTGLCAASAKTSPPSIRLKTDNGRFARADSNISAADVTIRFKDVSGAMPVLLGKTSVASAFAQHRMLVNGSMNQAAALVRVIEITEAYLFPKFMIKKTMRRVPKKQAPRAFVYIMMIFFGPKGPPRNTQAAETDFTQDVKASGMSSAEEERESIRRSEETEKGLEAVK